MCASIKVVSAYCTNQERSRLKPSNKIAGARNAFQHYGRIYVRPVRVYGEDHADEARARVAEIVKRVATGSAHEQSLAVRSFEAPFECFALGAG